MIGETQVGAFQPATTFNVYDVVAVDEDVGYRLVGEQRLERAQAHDVVLDLLDDGLALAQVERCLLFCQQAIDGFPDLGACFLLADRFDQRQVQNLQELVVDALFPLNLLVGNGLVGCIE